MLLLLCISLFVPLLFFKNFINVDYTMFALGWINPLTSASAPANNFIYIKGVQEKCFGMTNSDSPAHLREKSQKFVRFIDA